MNISVDWDWVDDATRRQWPPIQLLGAPLNGQSYPEKKVMFLAGEGSWNYHFLAILYIDL